MNGIDGTVQEIGIRSTRIKTLENRLVTIPNNQFTDQLVENVTAEPSRKMSVVLGLTYDTTPEQIEEALQILDIVVGGGTHRERVHRWFSGFGDFSLNVSLIYFIRKGEHWANVPSEINLEIRGDSMRQGSTSPSQPKRSSTRAFPTLEFHVSGLRYIGPTP